MGYRETETYIDRLALIVDYGSERVHSHKSGAWSHPEMCVCMQTNAQNLPVSTH